MEDIVEPRIIQIDRYTMRPLDNSDLDALSAIWADAEVTRFLPSCGLPISRANVEKSVESFIHHWEMQKYGIWAIVENFSTQMVGYCGLRYLNELDETEVLYGLAKAYWGKGIASQALKASISYGFDMTNLDKIIAMVLPENKASIRVIEKADLHYEKQIHIFGLDVLYYSLSRSTDRHHQ